MSQEELDPQEHTQPTEETSTPMPEAHESSEVVEETEEEQNTEVNAVEAEDDHESPKERKLIIPDFDASRNAFKPQHFPSLSISLREITLIFVRSLALLPEPFLRDLDCPGR